MSVTILLAPRFEESLLLRRAIRESDSEMAQNGTEPHISLAVFDECELSPCFTALERALSRFAALKIRFSDVGFFHSQTSVVFLQPEPSAELFRLQQEVHAAIGDLSFRCRLPYQPDRWHPHLTIAFPIAAALGPRLESKIRKMGLLQEYLFDRMEVVSTPPWTVRYTVLFGKPPNQSPQPIRVSSADPHG